MKKRRTARALLLPPTEIEYLNTLPLDEQRLRLYHLFQLGWSLKAVSSALIPPRPKTTVKDWITKIDALPAQERALPLTQTSLPIPRHKTPPAYQRKRPLSPGISAIDLETIQSLAPLARRFRAKMNSTASPRIANEQLTDICVDLYSTGVTIQELADAAGVTYRAMYKRILINAPNPVIK